MDLKRGVPRVREVMGDHVLKQAGDDHPKSGGPVLITYSWTLLAPCGHWEYTKQMQTGKGKDGEEGGGGKWNREEDT